MTFAYIWWVARYRRPAFDVCAGTAPKRRRSPLPIRFHRPVVKQRQRWASGRFPSCVSPKPASWPDRESQVKQCYLGYLGVVTFVSFKRTRCALSGSGLRLAQVKGELVSVRSLLVDSAVLGSKKDILQKLMCA